MDVHATRKIGRFGVVLPVVIREPAAGVGDGDEITAPGMIEACVDFPGLVQHLLHAWRRGQHGPDFFQDRRIIHIDMRELVIGDGKGAGTTKIERLKTDFILDRKPALLAKNPVQMHGVVHIRDAVLGKDHDLDHESGPSANRRAAGCNRGVGGKRG